MNTCCSSEIRRNSSTAKERDGIVGSVVKILFGQTKEVGKIGKTKEYKIERRHYIEGMNQNPLSILQLCNKRDKPA